MTIRTASGEDFSYLLLYHLCSWLDDLSRQGLVVWHDSNGWWWAWPAVHLQAQQPIPTLGATLLEAMVTRFPGAYAISS